MKESGIVTAVCAYLQLQENLGRLVYIRNNSGCFVNPKGNFYKMGKPGSPDILVFLPNGKSIQFEVKNEKGQLTDNQIKYKNTISKLGHDYQIVRSLTDVENYLKPYLS